MPDNVRYDNCRRAEGRTIARRRRAACDGGDWFLGGDRRALRAATAPGRIVGQVDAVFAQALRQLEARGVAFVGGRRTIVRGGVGCTAGAERERAQARDQQRNAPAAALKR
jgi:hypothetical protein